jgi:hypothetical protein
VMQALIHVAGDYKQKGMKTYKRIISGVVRPTGEKLYLVDERGNDITTWEVDIRKGNNPMTGGAIAVCRPRFDKWNAEGVLKINTQFIGPSLVKQMLEDAGIRSGLGSYRVSNYGWFGQYHVTRWNKVVEKIEEVKTKKVKALS